MNRLPRATWLNWSNCSLDDMYRLLVNIWNASIRLHFILSALCWSCSLNYGNTKGKGLLDCLCPTGASRGPQLAHSCSAVWSDVTLRRHYPHHYASLPLRAGNWLWQPSPLQPDWTSDRLTRSHKDGAPIHHYYMQTSGLCNPDIDTRFWISFSMSSVFLL